MVALSFIFFPLIVLLPPGFDIIAIAIPFLLG